MRAERGPVRAVFSTIVDATPKYEGQALLWAWSLLRAGVEPERVLVHHTQTASSPFASALAALQVSSRELPAHASGHPHCNKIQQLLHGLWPETDLIVLSDADLVWLDPHRLPVVQFAAKVVDLARPPEDRWRRLLRETRHNPPLIPVDITSSAQERTIPTNLNGGVYLLDAGIAEQLGEAWDERLRWVSKREALLDRFAMHRGQIALALALLDLAISPVQLDRGWNFPTHLKPQLLRLPVVHIRALHYHDRRDECGNLLPVGVGWIDDAIRRANHLVATMPARSG